MAGRAYTRSDGDVLNFPSLEKQDSALSKHLVFQGYLPDTTNFDIVQVLYSKLIIVGGKHLIAQNFILGHLPRAYSSREIDPAHDIYSDTIFKLDVSPSRRERNQGPSHRTVLNEDVPSLPFLG